MSNNEFGQPSTASLPNKKETKKEDEKPKKIQKLSSNKNSIKDRLHILSVQVNKLNKEKNELLRQKNTNQISKEQYLKEGVRINSAIFSIQNEIREKEQTYRFNNIELSNYLIRPDEKIDFVDSLDLENTIDSRLGNQIKSGGSNAEEVYEIKDTNLVVIKKSKGTYEFIGEMPYLTQQLDDNPNIPRTLQVFKHNDKTMQIIEKAQGNGLEQLSRQAIDEIPQEHFNEFVNNVFKLRKKGLKIDPSKKSNFFYDESLGFSLIDLDYGNRGVDEEGKIDPEDKEFDQNIDMFQKDCMTIFGGEKSETVKEKINNALKFV